jgi:hypothetical protein
MKLENQVVSLELSKQLKEAKYLQRGLWWWVKGKHHMKDRTELSLNVPNGATSFVYWNRIAVAPTVGELGEKLEHYTSHIYFMPNWKYHSWKVQYNNIEIARTITEANARAKMWLYLKKEGV